MFFKLYFPFENKLEKHLSLSARQSNAAIVVENDVTEYLRQSYTENCHLGVLNVQYLKEVMITDGRR